MRYRALKMEKKSFSGIPIIRNREQKMENQSFEESPIMRYRTLEMENQSLIEDRSTVRAAGTPLSDIEH